MNDPFYIQWHITDLCNLRCKHCYQDDFSRNGDLDWAGLQKVSDSILTTMREWDRRACINLTGGEPLLKPELFPLLTRLDQDPRVSELGIITNGTLLDHETVEKLAAFTKLRKLKISLDGPDADTNDAIRPEGTFKKIVKNVSEIRRDNRFEIFLMTTVMRRNFRSIPALIRLCQDLGVHGLILERFIPWGRGRGIRDEVLNPKEWRELLESLFEFFSMEIAEGDVFPYQAFEVILSGDEMELLGAPCVIGSDGVCIMPDSSVLPCRRFPITIGNLLNESLKEIWNESEILIQLREKGNLKGKCGKCQMEDCRGCRSLALALTGDYLEEDPHCWYEPKNA
jgi:MoaA/NifB/PqqE/SkfB family radical SAM enzyme